MVAVKVVLETPRKITRNLSPETQSLVRESNPGLLECKEEY
jgi:hypothetical protein